MALEIIILFAFLFSNIFASLSLEKYYPRSEYSMNAFAGLPFELQENIIQRTIFPFNCCVNKDLYEVCKSVIEKSWNIESKIPSIYKSISNQEFVPLFIKELCRKEKCFKDSIRYFVFNGISIPHFVNCSVLNKSRKCNIEEVILDIHSKAFPGLSQDKQYVMRLNLLRFNADEKKGVSSIEFLFKEIKKHKQDILCFNLTLPAKKETKEFLISSLKELSKDKDVKISVGLGQDRLFCINHDISIVLPPAYEREKHIFIPLVKDLFKNQGNTEFLSSEHVRDVFKNEKKSSDSLLNFTKLLNILNIPHLYYEVYRYFLQSYYFSEGEALLLQNKLVYKPPFLKTYLLSVIYCLKNSTYFFNKSSVVQHFVQDIIKFGSEKLMFDCCMVLMERNSGEAVTLIEHMSNRDFLKECVKKLFHKLIFIEKEKSIYNDLKTKQKAVLHSSHRAYKSLHKTINIIESGMEFSDDIQEAFGTSDDFCLKMYKNLMNVSEIATTEKFRGFCNYIVSCILNQPFSLKRIQQIFSIIKQENINFDDFIISKDESLSLLKIVCESTRCSDKSFILESIKSNIEKNIFNDSFDYYQFIVDCTFIKDYESSRAIKELITHALENYISLENNHKDLKKFLVLLRKIELTDERKRIIFNGIDLSRQFNRINQLLLSNNLTQQDLFEASLTLIIQEELHSLLPLFELFVEHLSERKNVLYLYKKAKNLPEFRNVCIEKLIRMNIIPATCLLFIGGIFLAKNGLNIPTIFSFNNEKK